MVSLHVLKVVLGLATYMPRLEPVTMAVLLSRLIKLLAKPLLREARGVNDIDLAAVCRMLR